MVVWTREGVLFPYSLSLPQTFNTLFSNIYCKYIKVQYYSDNFFPDRTRRFTMRRNHHLSPNSFPILFIKKLKQVFHDIVSQRLLLSQMRHVRAKKCVTPPYKSITFLGYQQFTTKSFRFSVTAALMTCFTKVFIFDSLFCHPLPDSHLCTKSLCKEVFFEISPQNHIDSMFRSVMDGRKSWMDSEEFPLHDSLPTKSSDL